MSNWTGNPLGFLNKGREIGEKNTLGTGACLCGDVSPNKGVKALYSMKLVIILKSMH